MTSSAMAALQFAQTLDRFNLIPKELKYDENKYNYFEFSLAIRRYWMKNEISN